MKRNIPTLTITLLLTLNVAVGQDQSFVKTHFDGDFVRYCIPYLKFPRQLALQGVSGYAEVEFRINKQGKIDSIDVIRTPHMQFANDIVQILLSTKDMWSATKINEQPVDYKYTFVVEYRTTSNPDSPPVDKSEKIYKKALKHQKKEKIDDALLSINEAIGHNPYKKEYYQLRSELLTSKGEQEKAKTDELAVEKIQRQLIDDVIMIVAYGSGY
ncbi:MAG: energy transducer TonB [Reichenbachiella sp.]|uniref:energy transducer TonB n=1 Tax=Reichenbachiella sp. TaxID=2184521 RepID=UPI0029674136|nr:energy transducer TonB [Reichenbachiella sp.]MDW3209096.1 energy transducer TonB [Reichenbachiella sp.]